MTLAEAVLSAHRNAPAVLAAIAQARAAAGQVILARAPLLPTVTGSTSANLSATNGTQVLSGVPIGGSIFLSTATVDMGVSGRWTVWDFGQTSARIRAADHSARGALADAYSAERGAMLQAAQAYMTLLADQELVQSSALTVQQRQRELDISAGLVAAGARPPIEQTRAQVQLDSARLDLTVNAGRTFTDAAQLSSALALDPTRGLRVVAPAPLVIDDDPVRAAEAAVAARPEVVAARERLLSAEQNLVAARRQYNPAFTTTASATARANDTYSGTTQTFGGVAPSQSTGVSIAFTVPIYDPTIAADIRIAEANVVAARAQVDLQVLNARNDAVTAAISVRSARNTLAQAEALAVGAAANLRDAEGRYRAGATNLLELVDAEASDATARANVIRARFQLEIAKVQLFAAEGRVTDLENAR